MEMKRLIKFAGVIIGILMTYGTGFAQNEVAKPGSFHQHGKNSADATVATENIDSVTVGAVMNYWAEPDAAIAGTNSTFIWTVAAAIGSQTAGTPTNLATVTFVAAPATGTITFHEVSPAGCAATDATPINIEVIAQPTAAFGLAPASQCTQAPGGLTFTLPLTLTSSLAVAEKLTVNYTVTNPDATILSGPTNIQLSKSAASFNVTLTGATQYGVYTVTINSVSDRISVKSSIAGNVTASTISLGVSRTPTSGNIYHVPNQ
jgi:hypothetical protein